MIVLLLAETYIITEAAEPTGYYQWIFGWVGPYEGNGCTGAGDNLRGYIYWQIPSWLADVEITGIYLRLVVNNYGSISLNVNRVGPYPPSVQDCADEPYTTGYATPGPDQEFYVPLGGSAISDLKAAAGGYFGVGLSGSGGDQFYYSHWAWYPDDAWLVIDYSPTSYGVGAQPGEWWVMVAGRTLEVNLPQEARVKIGRYDPAGRLSEMLWNGKMTQGLHRLKLAGPGLVVISTPWGKRALRVP